jgi:hypothetical protein
MRTQNVSRRQIQRYIDKALEQLLLPMGYERLANKIFSLQYDYLIAILEFQTHKWGAGYSIELGINALHDMKAGNGISVTRCAFRSHLGQFVRGLSAGWRSFPVVREEVDSLVRNDICVCANAIERCLKLLTTSEFFNRARPLALARARRATTLLGRLFADWRVSSTWDIAVSAAWGAVARNDVRLAKEYYEVAKAQLADMEKEPPETPGEAGWLRRAQTRIKVLSQALQAAHGDATGISITHPNPLTRRHHLHPDHEPQR